MFRPIRVLPLLPLGLCLPLLASCAGTSGMTEAPSTISVTGTVYYRLRIALPADAEVTVRLLDVTKIGVAPTTLAEQTFSTDGRQPPYPFSLSVEASKIGRANRYNLDAKITVGDEIKFVGKVMNTVLTAGIPNTVDVLVEPPR